MYNDIDKCGDLYVLEEINCRGEVKQHKFKIQVPLIKQAVFYALLSEDEKNEMEEEIDDFLNSFDNNSIATLLSSIIASQQFDFDPTSFITKLVEEGRFGVESEEQSYGVGITKELAYQAFCEIQNVDNDDWD